MKQKRSITYNGFGFPIKLVEVPIKLVDGEEVLDIDLYKLQILVIKHLIYKPTPLKGKQLRFIRKFLEMSTTDFAKKIGVTHPTILKWEQETTPINPAAEFCIRLYALQRIQKDDLRRLCEEISIEMLVSHRKDKESLIEIDDYRLTAC